MLKRLVLLVAVLSVFTPPVARDLRADAFGCPAITSPVSTKGYAQINVSSSAVGLSGVQGVMAIVVVEAADIRYRTDGTNPTASVGTPLAAGGGVVICGADMNTFKAIRQ